MTTPQGHQRKCPELRHLRDVVAAEATPPGENGLTVGCWQQAPAEVLSRDCDDITTDTACSGGPSFVMVSPEFLPCPAMTSLGHSCPRQQGHALQDFHQTLPLKGGWASDPIPVQ